MPSKAELEVKIAELEKELSVFKSAATAVPPASVADPDYNLAKLLDQSQLDLSAAMDRVEDLEKELKVLKTSSAPTITKVDNTVVLDGRLYPIVHRNTVKELATDMLKRYVREELTAVVIDKLGG